MERQIKSLLKKQIVLEQTSLLKKIIKIHNYRGDFINDNNFGYKYDDIYPYLEIVKSFIILTDSIYSELDKCKDLGLRGYNIDNIMQFVFDKDRMLSLLRNQMFQTHNKKPFNTSVYIGFIVELIRESTIWINRIL